jgi:hypothetical protein
MAELVNLKNKNPDLVLVFLGSLRRTTPRQVSSCLAEPCRAVLRQRFELVLTVRLGFVCCACELRGGICASESREGGWGFCAREKRGGWAVCAREKEKRGGWVVQIWKTVYEKKKFVNRFPFFCSKFSGQRK